VPKELRPPELDRLVDFSERPRTDDWSLRAALVRYAQGDPVRVRELMEQVRRIEGVFGARRKVLERDGPELWAALTDGGPIADGEPRGLVEVLRVAVSIDTLADTLASWAVARAGVRPDQAVDEVTAAAAARLDELGVAREHREPPRGAGRGV
jgi:hypothetical protein